MDASVSERVIQAAADAKDRDELELPPLYDTIDPDAFEELIAGMSSGEISFQYAGCEITVTADAQIRVEERLNCPFP
jgi:hypothetical protein